MKIRNHQWSRQTRVPIFVLIKYISTFRWSAISNLPLFRVPIWFKTIRTIIYHQIKLLVTKIVGLLQKSAIFDVFHWVCCHIDTAVMISKIFLIHISKVKFFYSPMDGVATRFQYFFVFKIKISYKQFFFFFMGRNSILTTDSERSYTKIVRYSFPWELLDWCFEVYFDFFYSEFYSDSIER